MSNGVRSAPEGYAETDLGMSNLDHTIDDGFEEHLRNEPAWGRHAAWNFNGRVWYENGQFHEQVWRYGQPVEHFSSSTLTELMEKVSDEYGWE
jgi:hypothetical protein